MLKRRWRLILLTFAIVVVLTAVYLTIKASLYEATAVVKIPAQGNTVGGLSAALGAFLPMGQSSSVATEIETIKLRSIAESVIRKLELDKKQKNLKRDWRQILSSFKKRLKVRQRGKSDLIEITAIGDSPEEARDIADAVASEYIKLSEASSQKLWDGLMKQMEERLDETRLALENSRNQLHAHEAKEGISTAFSPILTGAGVSSGAPGTQYAVPDVPQAAVELKAVIIRKEVELAALKKSFSESDPNVVRLERELAASKQKFQQEMEKAVEKYNKQFGLTRIAAEVVFNQQLYSSLVAKHEELKAQYVMQNRTPEIIESAVKPLHRSSPRRALILMAGAILGLFLGLGLAILNEFMDDSMHSAEDATRALDLPVLGRIPRFSRTHSKKDSSALEREQLISYADSSRNMKARDPYKEAFRALQLELMAEVKDDPGARSGLTLLVTSSEPEEGKSTIAANLAISLAQTGWKVLLVDANRYSSAYSELLSLNADAGFMDVFMGKSEWDDAVRNTSIDKLCIITCGGEGEQADLSGLLISPQLESFIRTAKERFDITIFDSSSVMSASESAAIGSKVDSVILVIKADDTQKDVILQAKERMQNSGSNILGTVLNCVRAKSYS